MTHKATDSDIIGTLPPKDVYIGVAGCSGRVGQLLCKELLSGHHGPHVHFAGGSVRPGMDIDGKSIGDLANCGPCEARVFANADELFDTADAVIDFTTPEATRQHLWLAAKHHKPLIIGTTGLTKDDENELHDASLETQIVYAANMSVGVNLLLALVEEAAKKLDENWDIEIHEVHHRHKVDAPSGTALALGKAAAAGRHEGFPHPDREGHEESAPPFTFTRHGKTGEREKGGIGFSIARGGDVIGEHTVTFFGEGERIELAHKSVDRGLYARGAIRAAQWAVNQDYGLYSMRDVLGL